MNELEQIMAAFRDLGSPTAPVLSRPASTRPYTLGDDPMADFAATKKNLEGQTGNILAALAGGSLNLGKALASFLGPVVRVSATGPGLRATAGQPFKTAEQMGVQDQLWHAANTPWTTPPPGPAATGVVRPPAEIIPIRAGLAKGNIRNQTEAEVLSAVDKQWSNMATQGGPFSDPQETAINTILGGLKQSPSLRVAVDNTKWNAPYPKTLEDALSNYVKGLAKPKDVHAAFAKEGWSLDKGALQKRSLQDFQVYDPQGNPHFIQP